MNAIWFGIAILMFGLLIVFMHYLFTRRESELMSAILEYYDDAALHEKGTSGHQRYPRPSPPLSQGRLRCAATL